MSQTLNYNRTSTFLRQAVLTALLGVTSVAALALPSDRNQPISLVADRATYNENMGSVRVHYYVDRVL